MRIGLATSGLAFVSGTLSILSPCVLPLLPIILGSARTEHRFAPLALTAGVTTSFVSMVLLAGAMGFPLGAQNNLFHVGAAALLIVFGTTLLAPVLERRVAAAASLLSRLLKGRLGGVSTSGLMGQAWLGLLLGAVWCPCAGPTLGAVAMLAATGEASFYSLALTMSAFGIGAALPLVALGALSRDAQMHLRIHLHNAAAVAKLGLGISLVVIGLLTLTGLDKRLETALVDALPEWLMTLATLY